MKRYFQRGIFIIIAVFVGSLIISLIPHSSNVVHAAGPTVQPYAEIQAEDSTTNGTIIGPNRFYPSLPSEAIGRRAVTLSAQGQFVEFTVPVTSNSIVMRYSIPDNAAGTGQTQPLSLYINGVRQTFEPYFKILLLLRSLSI